MSKIVTYLCDCCDIVYPLEELEAVQVYVFGNPDNDPKLLDYEMVCPECRNELLQLLDKWKKTVDEEVEQLVSTRVVN